MVVISVVLLGLVVGSFLTVVTDSPDGLSFFRRKRSHCPRCGHILGVRDLIPLFSFIFLCGNCRFCGKPIPRWHFAVEATTLFLFLLAYITCLKSGENELVLVFLLIFLSLLLALTVTDLRFWTLPDIFISLFALTGMVRIIVLGAPSVYDSIIGGALGLALLGSITLFSRGQAMGWGDVKLAGAMGLVLGWGPLLLTLLLAFVVGGTVGMALLVSKRRTLKSQIPFGPFLTSAAALLLLFPRLYDSILLFMGLM